MLFYKNTKLRRKEKGKRGLKGNISTLWVNFRDYAKPAARGGAPALLYHPPFPISLPLGL